MTQLAIRPEVERRPLPTRSVPARRIVPRARLTARVDAALKTSRIVIVAAEVGSGKTSAVAAWAAFGGPSTAVCWRDLHGVDTLAGSLDTMPGDPPLPVPVGGRSPSASDGRHPARGVTGSPGRRILVLDDFPIDPAPEDAEALERLVQRMGERVALIVTCTGSPRLDRQRLRMLAEADDVTSADLAMTSSEIAAVLSSTGVDPTPSLVEQLRDQTFGWAWGVGHGASLLARSASAAAALRENELAIADYLRHSILRDLTEPEVDVLTATSVIGDVTPDLLSAIVGEGAELPDSVTSRSRGFVRWRADGSFAVHPLLRRLLRNQLRRRPALTQLASRRAAQCSVDRGNLREAVSIAVEGADWSWAARLLIETLQVPRLLMSDRDLPVADPRALDRLGEVEPLLRAAVALSRSWPEVAERALEDSAAAPEATSESSTARSLTVELVRMALARWHGDPDQGLDHHRTASALMSDLSLTQRAAAPELASLLQSHRAAFELMQGAPDQARVALERGARAFRAKPAPSAAGAPAAACLGQLAWQEATAGELTAALRHAGALLTARPPDSNEVGVVHAQLATVWCHVSRDELDQAIQRFSALNGRRSFHADDAFLPEIAQATALTAARLAASAGHGGVSYELSTLCRSLPCSRQYEHQLILIRAEQELDAGSPATALQLLGEAIQHSAEVYALRARAWIQLGDLAAVGGALRIRPVETLALLPRLQLNLIEAWLATVPAARARQRVLLDRVLRTAGVEKLRSPIAWAKPWLLEAIEADPVLLQRHGPFLASVGKARQGLADGTLAPTTAPGPAVKLTEREIDILQRLGALRTNDEIAADLYLSTNTVKTHLKSLYRKLDVTRRSDAFRRGRALGLC